MNTLVIGIGEIGSALCEILKKRYHVATLDVREKIGNIYKTIMPTEIIHICFPYSDNFINMVIDYMNEFKPKYTVIHSTVPVGTTLQLPGKVFHSPVRASHPKVIEGLLTYLKFLSFDNADLYDANKVTKYFEKAGIKTKIVVCTKKTELAKLLSLCRYGTYIAFAKEQESICEHFGLDYFQVVAEYEKTTNEGLRKLGLEDAVQPLLYPFEDYVGGHCTVEDMEILLKQLETPLLKEAYKIDRGTVIWPNCNIYPGAKIGKGCSIGQFTEIDNGVAIGNKVRIGAHCFIPEGVTIGDDCFIGPKVAFSNDKHPPSNKKEWRKTLVKKGAMIGVGSVILPGITIGENAVVGAGSVVTKSIPDNEVWYGQAAYHHGKKEEVYDKC